VSSPGLLGRETATGQGCVNFHATWTRVAGHRCSLSIGRTFRYGGNVPAGSSMRKDITGVQGRRVSVHSKPAVSLQMIDDERWNGRTGPGYWVSVGQVQVNHTLGVGAVTRYRRRGSGRGRVGPQPARTVVWIFQVRRSWNTKREKLWPELATTS